MDALKGEMEIQTFFQDRCQHVDHLPKAIPHLEKKVGILRASKIDMCMVNAPVVHL